jgi:bifunctional DNase/RNase
MYVRMEVVGVRIEMPSNQPIVLLKEVEGSRFLPIWVGAHEATAIAFAQQGMSPKRPLTHDLMADVLNALDATLIAVQITDLVDGVFYSELLMRRGEEAMPAVSARPSDAIALALRTKTNIMATSELLDSAGIEIPERVAEQGQGGAGQDVEMERFREFLDQINPEDFAG